MFPVTSGHSPACYLMRLPPNTPVFGNGPFFGTSNMGRLEFGNGEEESVSFGYGRYRARTEGRYYEWSLGVTNENLTRGNPAS
jgi:hypothetical protein